MRHKVQALYHDPANLYGFRLEPDALDTLLGTKEPAERPGETPAGASDTDRFSRMIRRNRDGLG